MTENSRLENVLKEADYAIHINMPPYIKNAKALFRFEHIGIYEGELILMGMVYVRIETEDKYAIEDCYGFSETYGIERTKEEAEQIIIKDLLTYYHGEDDHMAAFWKSTKLDKVRWMDNRIDMNKFFSLLDTLHVGLLQNMPLYVENAYFSFSKIEEDESDNATNSNGIITFHVIINGDSLVLEWDKYWYSGEQEDIDLAFCSWAEAIIENEDYSRIWFSIDYEVEDWKCFAGSNRKQSL